MQKLDAKGVAGFLSRGVTMVEGGITGHGDAALKATGHKIQETNFAGPQQRGLSYAASIVAAPTVSPT